MGKKTVILGASSNPERYSNKALKMLLAHGHEVVPVHPALRSIENIPVVGSLDEVMGPIDTVTVYLSPERGAEMADAIATLRPARVILNPGAESDELQRRLEQEGILTERACTLVLLQTGQY